MSVFCKQDAWVCIYELRALNFTKFVFDVDFSGSQDSMSCSSFEYYSQFSKKEKHRIHKTKLYSFFEMNLYRLHCVKYSL